MAIITRILFVFLLSVFLPVLSKAQEPGFGQLEQLKEPRFSTHPKTKVIMVEAKGDPNVIGGKAFGLLYQTYFSMKDGTKGLPPAARARWPVWENAPKEEWVGLYALPVPESVSALPAATVPEGLKMSLTTWEYGEIAEILHVGPYDKEDPTIRRLRDFIDQHGYQVAGEHEEEYVRGPSMTGKGDPEKYLTIIRYRVHRASHAEYIEIAQ
jgi:hypothetical protein